MVRGVDKFKEYFGKYSGQYAFIGGTACDLILGKQQVEFRVTKDLDIVLLVEAISQDFVENLIKFIEDGGYQHIKKGSNKNQFYRFEKPIDNSFPKMIELFSRRPDYLKNLDTKLAPIHISDDVVSLSAILLDDEYYALLKEGVVVIDEISVLDIEYLMLFKIKAWLDLSGRKAEGEVIDSKNIKKHKNDIFRLAANIEKDSRLPIDGKVRDDVVWFLEVMKTEEVDLSSLGIRETTSSELVMTIKNCFNL